MKEIIKAGKIPETMKGGGGWQEQMTEEERKREEERVREIESEIKRGWKYNLPKGRLSQFK